MSTIDNQEKGAHLTYGQQLYIYSSYCEGENFAGLCERVEINTYTCKLIIKVFSSNQNRSKIYCRIRCKKMSDLVAIKANIKIC